MTLPLLRDGQILGTSPRDGSALAPVPVTPLEQLPDIVARARAAQASHAKLPVAARAKLLDRLRDAILARGEALVSVLAEEAGKPAAEAWLHEVVATADLASYWTGEGAQHLAPHEPSLDPVNYPGKRAVIERVPRGVIALITPWNFPVAIPLRTLFPALLAGNAVVMKPSEYTPRCAELIADATREVFGPDLVVMVHGAGDVGAGLIHAGVDAVIFTGSVRTGRKVAAAAAERLIPAGLELGGKDAAVVLEDADVERAARGILWGAMANSGQNCAGIERVYAVGSVAVPLRRRMVELANELRPVQDYGPLTTDAQLAVVEAHVASARAEGEVLAGGTRLDRPGRWYPPTIVGDLPNHSEPMAEETFGPVVPVVAVPTERAAVEAANDSRFGLTASVWTRDLERGERVARELRAGTVVVNNHGFTGAIPALPWSGTGESGYGVTNSSHTLDVLTRPRAVVVDARRATREMWWHPYTPALEQVGRSLATLRGGGGAGEKAKALGALLQGFAARWK
ncbi:MAG: aldehyde dehydrogenase family protein [Myxococcales bacterium]|nr:aldehyde dehydrogenase family protein [Myxococcales bacterium]